MFASRLQLQRSDRRAKNAQTHKNCALSLVEECLISQCRMI